MTRKRNWGMTPEAQADRATPKTLQQPEHAPAVAVKKPRRSYQVNTQLYPEFRFLLDEMCIQMHQETGRHHKKAEVIELALQALQRERAGTARQIALHE